MGALRNEPGFTLLDNLLALVILSVVLLGLVGLATTVITGNAISKSRTVGLTLVQDKIEDTRRSGYNYALTGNQTVAEPYGSMIGYPFFRRVTVTEVNTPGLGMQTVTVTVYWGQDAHSVTLSTLLAR
ncbi:MAG: type IV pilus modification PilV family protein [Nitrospiraceae bacterium]